MFIGGLLAVAGVAYFMHRAGYFNEIFDAINEAIDKIKNTKPLEDGDGNGNGNGEDKCSSGKIKCKDGKCDTQSKCDSQAKCKSGEHWSPSAKKCVKSSSLALAYTTPVVSTMGGVTNARMRAYRLYYQ